MPLRIIAHLLLTTLIFISCTHQESTPETKRLPIAIGTIHSPLLSVDSLHHYQQNGFQFNLIDIRPADDFKAGHIPGAVNLWRPDIADDNSSITSLTASKEKLEKLFGSLGLIQDLPIVLYNGKVNADAANLWWILWRFGKRDVTVIDGGINAWKKSNYEIREGPETRTATNFSLPPLDDRSRYASIDSVKNALGDTGTILLDVRTIEEFTGATTLTGAKKGGRIPGSVPLNFAEIENGNEGCFFLKPAAEIKAILAAKGISPDKKIICYCQSGVRSALMTFALTEILDYPRVLNYDGSWEEWSQHDELPYETGQ